ncbi:MAG: LPP20 family lipoprotein [bacterium]
MKMKKKHLISSSLLIILSLFIQILPCAASEPDSAAEYPPAQYLTATGIGQSEQEARRQAKAEMSSIFEAQVTSSMLSIVKSALSGSGEETVTRDAAQKIGILSAVELKGVTIEKTWYDKKQKVYYALAVLDKQKARREWQGKIDSFDDKIETSLNSLNAITSTFSRLQALLKINKVWIEREVIASRLRVLGFPDASMADYEIRDIYKKINELKSNIKIYLDFAKDKCADRVVSLISEELNQEGYILKTDQADSNLIIKGSVTVEQVDIDIPDWKYARATITVSIIDTEADAIVGKFEETKRGSHLSYSEAENNAIKKVSSILAERIIAYFKDVE